MHSDLEEMFDAQEDDNLDLSTTSEDSSKQLLNILVETKQSPFDVRDHR